MSNNGEAMVGTPNAMGPLSRVVEGGKYLAGIDGLRAVAVVMVMIYHLTPNFLPGGFTGVDVFFVISGFVVTSSLLRERTLSLAGFLGRFYARRFRRIVPALVTCIMATVICSVAVIPDAWLSDSLRDVGLAAFFGFSNFVLSATQDGYFAPRTEFNPYAHTWSLGVEEQFYLLFPLFLWVVTAAKSRLAFAVATAIFVLLLSASLAWSAWSTRSHPVDAYFLLPSRYWELGAGVALSLMGAERRRLLWQRLAPVQPGFTGAALLILGAIFSDQQQFPFPWALFPVFGTLMLICVLEQESRARSWAGCLLGARSVVLVGLLSYSLYLWHWPVYTLMRWTIGLETPGQIVSALILTFFLAYCSYSLVELPAQRASLVRAMSPTVTVVLGLALVGGGYLLADQWYYRHWITKHTVVSKYASTWYPSGVTPREFAGDHPSRGCRLERGKPNPGVTRVNVTDCGAPDGASGQPRIHVVGDSHAGAYGRMLAGLATHEGISHTVYSRGGCALAPLIANTPNEECEHFRSMARSEILRSARPGDIVFLASLRLPRLTDQDGRMANPVPTVSVSAQEMLEASALIEVFQSAGLVVILDLPKPLFLSPAFRCADWFNRRNPVCDGGMEISRQFLERYRHPVMDAAAELVRRHPGLMLWDTVPVLCEPTLCRSMQASDPANPLFFDADHLSGYGNDLLYRHFLQIIRSSRDSPARP